MKTNHKIILGDALASLAAMPAKSVHCCLTSPPYMGQRDYGAGAGEIGKEETVEAYIERLLEVCFEVLRVLREDGTFFLNIGDRYLDGALAGLPWRAAFAMAAGGATIRQEIIWHKPSPMPSASPGRCTLAHEQVFMFTKGLDYFYDSVAIQEPANHGGTKNRRSVWTIASTPYAGAHFATMPTTLAEICIKAGTSEAGCCSKCGAPLERMVEKKKLTRERPNEYVKRTGKAGTGNKCANTVAGVETITTGWKRACQCEPAGDAIPCTVLDPFGGSGTTGAVAHSLGRDSILIELNPDYADLAKQRIGELFTNGDNNK